MYAASYTFTPTKKMGKGKLIDEIFGAKCEGNYIQPTFITDYSGGDEPADEKHRSKPGLVERFELILQRQRDRQRLQRTERPHRAAGTF